MSRIFKYLLRHCVIMLERIFTVKDIVKFSDEKAKLTQVAATEHSIIFVWGVKPSQEVEAHIHPKGQDTWIMIQGELTYYLGNGQIKKIKAGQIDVAPKDSVHGCINEGKEDAIFVSIYSPKDIGYEQAPK
jgi:quercetin dioxygenase-like cupin family protein